MTRYYTGICEGKLLTLPHADIDLEKSMLRINKSYHREKRKAVVITPKTPKSNRVSTIPEVLKTCLKEYMAKM